MNAALSKAALSIVTQRAAGLSGKVHLLRENLPRLVQAGFDVELCAQVIDPDFEGRGARLLPFKRSPFGRRRRLRQFVEQTAALEREGRLVVLHGEGMLTADVVHVHNTYHRAHEGIHGTPLDAGRSPLADLQARTLRQGAFTRIVANSQLAKDELAARYDLDPERIDVVYPACDLNRFRPCTDGERRAARREKLGVPSDGPLVGLITSGDFQKRAVDVFLKSLTQLAPHWKKCVDVVIVGKERRLDPYRELARASGLGERIRFLTPQVDVEELYLALDVYVHPARYEEFGMSVLEAMACGLPVLTGRDVGAAELLPHHGELLEAIEVDELAVRLERLLDDDAARTRLADSGYQASREHDWDRNVAGHIASYALAARARGLDWSRREAVPSSL